jgi:predicted aspartyl protease
VIEGRIDGGLPCVTLDVEGFDWVAVIDTGFDGFLELPGRLRGTVSARYTSRIRSALAGGQFVDEDLYSVVFPFDGAVVQAEATFVPSPTILIGNRLLFGHRLEIDYPVGTVRLERTDASPDE